VADLAETLLALGRCEVVVGDLRRQGEQLPRAIEQAEARAQLARERVAEQRKRLAEAEAAHRVKERELQDAEGRRSKFQAQTAMVKTNTEYTTLLHEIDRAAELISDVETQILEALERVDESSQELRRIEAEERLQERTSLDEAEKLKKQLVEVSAALLDRESERLRCVSVLPGDTRGRYERVCRQGGLGTALVVGQSCARCHRDIPIHTTNQVRAGELHHCGNCGRILIIDEP